MDSPTTLASEPMEPGNSASIVSSVYLVVLLPWAFLYLHDFISERWRTINRTRFAGYIHLFAAFVPTPYIIVYIILQVNLPEPDFKEMCAALTAVVFSTYHVMRTITGLYQLSSFRRWAIQTALLMESASFPCELSAGAGKQPLLYEPPSPWYQLVSRTVIVWIKRNLKRLKRIARRAGRRRGGGKYMSKLSSHISLRGLLRQSSEDDDSIDLDTGGGTGEVRNEKMRCPNHDVSFADNVYSERTKRIEFFVDNMVVNCSIIDNEFIESFTPMKFRLKTAALEPRHRKLMFVRWTIVYLAQFGQEWLRKCKTVERDENTWSNQRWNFASRVWATAALRLEAQCPHRSSIDHGRESNSGGVSFLGLKDWELLAAHLDENIFLKKNAMEKCFLNGYGMPFDSKVMSEGESMPTRGVYKSLIKDAIDSLPTRYYDAVENIDYTHIEWFAIFLGVPRWGGCPPIRENNSARNDSALSLQAAPFKVLQQQLGLPRPPTIVDCGFPFLGHLYGSKLWGNRCVLQVSARIDNWIGFVIGDALGCLLDNEEKYSPDGELFRNAHKLIPKDETSTQKEHADHPEYKRSHEIRYFHHQLELARLQHELAREYPKHEHLEHSLTFMGCVMETVRSEIAESLNDGIEVANWCPGILDEEFAFPISAQLNDSLKAIYFSPFYEQPEKKRMMSKEDLKKRGYNASVEERILWECQNGTYWRLQRKLEYSRRRGNVPSTVETTEAMVLCMLAFPGVKIASETYCYDSLQEYVPDLVFELNPVLGPQPLCIAIFIDCQKLEMRAKIRSCSHSPGWSSLEFRWQDWRDAFLGRMVAAEEWQKDHYMTEVPIRLTKKWISNGFEDISIYNFSKGSPADVRHIDENHVVRVWNGWRPFRAGLTKFELMHSELVVVGDMLPEDSYNHSGDMLPNGKLRRTDSSSRRVDKYTQAPMEAITDASFHLDSLLTLDTDVVQQTHENQTGTLAETAAKEASSSDDMESFKIELKRNREPVPKTQNEIVELIMKRAQKQDPIAMHRLSKMVLNGTRPYKKNMGRALQLMERALVLGRRIETAELLVKTLLERVEAGNEEENIERVLRNLELIWRHISSRRNVIRMGGGRPVRQWKGQQEEELDRVSQLRDLHLRVIAVRPKAAIVRDLADRLSTWSTLPQDEVTAIKLYETAIIARQDAKAMMELGRKFDSSAYPQGQANERCNDKFALKLYERASKLGYLRARGYSKNLAMYMRAEKNVNTLSVVKPVLERAAQGGDVGLMTDLSLILLHGEGGVNQNVAKGQHYANLAAYGDTYTKRLERGGVRHLGIDEGTANELRRSASSKFGREETNGNS